MNVAIISDIHGNIVAFEAVLEDLAQQENIDHIIVAGDFFVFGPAPAEVLATIRHMPEARFLLGNTDRYLWQGSYPAVYGPDGWQGKLRRSYDWTLDHLGPEGLRFLEKMPPQQVIRFGDRQLLAVHGSPRSDEEGLTMDTDIEMLERMPIDPGVAVIACGHTHVPLDRIIGHIRVVNAGSIGFPFDGDPRACYAIISNLSVGGNERGQHHLASIQVDLRRVAYDVEKVVDQLNAVNHPAADIGAYNLRTGRPVGDHLMYSSD